jgi:hypothetical protein
MSVQLAGSEGFRYQDLVTAWIALQAAELSDAMLYPEKSGGEDAELSFGCSSGPVFVEIQVKGQRTNQISLPFLVNVLAHFPPRKASNCLFERLLGDRNRYLVLVVRQRCEDSVSAFVKEELLPTGPNKTIRAKDAQSAADELARWQPETNKKLGELDRKRIAACKQLAQRSISDIADALSRVVIIEKVERRDLLDRCTLLLRKFSIFEDRAADAIRELTEAVTESQAPQADALLAIRAILERRSGPTLKPKGYVLRGLEPVWQTTLSNRNVLLLSGHPRCGKSDAARYVGHTFQLAGYDVRTGSDMDVARSFLEDSIAPRRVFILDDPLEQDGDVHSALAALYKLVSGATSNRKIIVTQSEGALFEARKRRTLKECNIGGIHQWHDLSIPPSKDFIAQAWENISNLQIVPGWLKNKIRDGILSSQIDLELGCLRHLASIAEDIPESASIDEISRSARQQAEQLSLSLAGRPGMDEVLIALATGTTVELNIHETELRFILAPRVDDERPSLRRNVLGTMYSVGANLPAEPEFPDYVKLAELSDDHDAALAFLEKRRYVERDERGFYNVSLPFYRAAANETLRSTDRFSVAKVRRIVDRGLFCLSPQTSRAVARNIKWILSNTDLSLKNWFEMLTSAVNNSMFPATKDLSLEVLIRLPRLEDGDIETNKKRDDALEECIFSVTSESLDAYRWRSGEAWLVREGINHRKLLFESDNRTDPQKIRLLQSGIDDPSFPLPTPEEAVLLLESSRRDRKAFSEVATLRLLRYDERFLRAEAAKLWLSHSTNPCGAVWDAIRGDEHPAMTLASIDGIMKGWHGYAPETGRALLEELAQAATKSLSMSLVISRLLDAYAASEFRSEIGPWQIFVRLLPDLLAGLSASTWLNEAKLYDAISQVQKVAPPDAILVVWDSWLTYVEARASADFLLGDSAMSIGWVLLDITRKHPDLRARRVERLLAVRGTAAATRFARDLLRHWELLTEAEQKVVASMLNQDRRDAKWLLAIAVTQPNLRTYEHILPRELRDFSQAAGMHALDVLGDSISDAAIRIYCGSPSILNWLDLSHTPAPQWKDIILAVAADPEHQRFAIAMRTVFRMISPEITIEFLEKTTPENLPNYFDAILDACIYEADWKHSEVWAALLRQCEQHGFLAKALSRMALAANAILSDWNDFERWIESERYRKILQNALRADFAGFAVYVLHLRLQRGNIEKARFLEEVRQLEKYWEESEFMLNFTPRHLLLVSEKHADLFDEETIQYLKRQEEELEDSRRKSQSTVSGDAERCEDWCIP